MANTLFDKIWDSHVVQVVEEGPTQLYIDRLYCHEVTSPQAFDGLRRRHLQVFRPQQVFCMPDHNIMTHDQGSPELDPVGRHQVETLDKNCAEFGLTEFKKNTPENGVIHVVGPETGLSLPGMTIVCGDSHTSTHGDVGAVAFGIGTSEVEMVLASQCILQQKPKSMRITITTDDTEVVVTVTGNTKTVVYDGTEHSVESYTVDVNGLPITVTPKAGTEAKASGTNAGTYYMGLTADDFTAESNNYSNIRIAVTDGWLKIDPITDKVTVTITENADTVEYDGKEHSVTGYASIVSDHALYDVANVAETPTDAWTAKGTDAGSYPVGIKSGDFKNTSGNFTNVEFVIVDGELVITRRGENPGSPVTLRADDSTVMFDGDYHGYVGHIATNLAEGHSVRSVKSDFTARNVGRYEDKIDLHDAIIVDADGKDVTRNYVLTYQPGTLEITPFEGEVVVTVTGNTGLFRYDGKIHTVEGYTLEATVPFFTEDDIRFTGDATISEVRPGDYVMNLKDEEFSAANDNFTSVKFVVIDGSMRIYTVRYTVAWMFDTDQMLTGDSPNRYFTSMANYIDRSDISLVLHTGNVVADAGAQSQWDVFNNAMQPLYDDEEVDVLMIAAEKEAADGSLFLQQPVREDFKEEDLFENGKGFVRRFNIGEKSVILVGLGADAMTEEGYKWAREKFNSDKDASGILLVNNYLLEDMRKPDKIDERALDLEKNVVKACSNVRMVLSSSGGYSSHYEFYYGERKVIAINSDIEAAAKAGYFTQLTFNEDLNILSVTNLCPYTYDFVYNERQAYKECYVLSNVL